MIAVEEGATLEFRVSGLATGGRGLAKAPDGRTALVAGALAGERVQAKIEHVAKDYLMARTTRIILASPQRVEPPCAVYGRCGGCDLMHLEYQAQLRTKVEWVERALSRLKGIPRARAHAAPSAWAYRNRVRFQVKGGKLGFFAEKSHDLVPVSTCPVAYGGIEAILPSLRQMAAKLGPGLEWIEVLGGPEGWPYLTLGLAGSTWPNQAQLDYIRELARWAQTGGARLEVGGRQSQWAYSARSGVMYYGGEDLALFAFPGLFCQVNFAANRHLVGVVQEMAGPGEGKIALDLYAGSGNLSLPLAGRGFRVAAVERDLSAKAALNFMAGYNSLGKLVGFENLRVDMALERFAGQKRQYDLVVLDPPRAGAKGLMPKIAALGPKRVIYVSCHAAALARDAAELAKLGFAPASLDVVDMFPHTGHVETVLVMDREPDKRPAPKPDNTG